MRRILGYKTNWYPKNFGWNYNYADVAFENPHNFRYYCFIFFLYDSTCYCRISFDGTPFEIDCFQVKIRTHEKSYWF